MNHPLTRIVTPIVMIVFVAAFAVTTATIDSDNRTLVGEATVATAVAEPDRVPALTGIRTAPDSP